MLTICNDLTTQNSAVELAVKNKDKDFIAQIAKEAKNTGFDCLELYAANTEDEAEALLFIIDSVKESDLELLLRIKDASTYKKVLPKVYRPGIIAPVELSGSQAQQVFDILKNLDEGWDILFTQAFSDGSAEPDVEELLSIISKAEQAGIMPDLIYIEPLAAPLIEDNRSLTKMRRSINAFINSWPEINFYLDLPLIAKGLDDETTLMNVFIGMANMAGVSAFSFSTEHESHLEAIKAAQALLNDNGGIQEFVK